MLSVRPVPAYPRVPRLWFSSERDRLDSSIAIRLLPFPNVTPLKQLVIGLDVLFGLVGWAWRKRKQKRIVLSYNLSVPPAAFTLLGARLARAKVVASVNDVNVPGETVPATSLYRLDFALQRWLMPRFDGHIVVTDQIARDFIPGRPYVRIEGGVDRNFLERTPRRRRLAEREAALVLAFAGTLNDVNGILLVIQALEYTSDVDLQLRIAGSGPREEMVKEAVRRDARIQFLGMLDRGGVASLYDDADVLLNIRLTEAVNTQYFFPSKLIECLGSGVPTISTRVAHSDTEFSGLAYFLDEESPQGLAALISFVASRNPEDRAALGARARAYISAHKTWDTQAAKAGRYMQALIKGSQTCQV